MEVVCIFGRGFRPMYKTLSQGRMPYAVLTFLCAALFLPGLSAVPPTDRDEARFMQASKQMLETDDIVTIQFQEEPRTKKPIGIHWLQVASVKLFAGGDTQAEWAYRLPSVISAWLAVLCTFAIGRRLFDSQTGLLAAGLLACTVLTVIEAHLAKTDAALLLTVIVAHLALLEFYLSPAEKTPPFMTVLLFWSAIGLGLLIKGPIIAIVVVATALSLSLVDKNALWLGGLQPTAGIPIAVAFLLPWLVGSMLAGNEDVIFQSLSEDFLPKLVGGEESHGAPPGSYLAASPLTLWPASLIIFPGLLVAWRHRSEPAVRFALAWAIAPWLMFELAPTKLPHYILPAIPGLALASAAAVAKADFSIPRWSKIFWGLCGVILAIGLAWATWTYGGARLIAGAIAVILIAAAALTWTPERNLRVLVPVLAITIFGLVFAGLLPSLSDLSLSRRLADTVERNGGGPIALSRYHEPSAVFLLGTGTWLTNRRNAVAHVAADPKALAAVAQDELGLVENMITESNGTLVIVDRLDGYNYAKGRPETLVLIRSRTSSPSP